MRLAPGTSIRIQAVAREEVPVKARHPVRESLVITAPRQVVPAVAAATQAPGGLAWAVTARVLRAAAVVPGHVRIIVEHADRASRARAHAAPIVTHANGTSRTREHTGPFRR